VKCPKCGFVSYPGLAQCKKCGYALSSAVAQSARMSASRFRSVNRPESLLPPVFPSKEDQIRTVDPPAAASAASPLPRPAREGTAEVTNSESEPGRTWPKELAKRIELFHNRRARLRRASDPEANLEFNFSADAQAWIPLDAAGPNATDATLDLVLERGAGQSGDRASTLDSVWLAAQRRRENPPSNDDDVEWALESIESREPEAMAHSPAEPVEIVLDTGRQEEQPDFVAGTQAGLAGPLGHRFAAGILDLFVLVLAFGLFTIIFWESGGRLTWRPLDLSVMALAAAFFVLLYFGLFTGLAFATPGQSALALRVRTLEGGIPDPTSALWRAFGYLVSAAALMLGFVWAVFDGDRLAWHDRMSGTCLVAVERTAERA
jgi:uncharacterized RDD family membrane protein YckC